MFLCSSVDLLQFEKNFCQTQEDPLVNNQRPRIYISLECPFDPDLTIQQFGCIHRTGIGKRVNLCASFPN